MPWGTVCFGFDHDGIVRLALLCAAGLLIRTMPLHAAVMAQAPEVWMPFLDPTPTLRALGRSLVVRLVAFDGAVLFDVCLAVVAGAAVRAEFWVAGGLADLALSGLWVHAPPP